MVEKVEVYYLNDRNTKTNNSNAFHRQIVGEALQDFNLGSILKVQEVIPKIQGYHLIYEKSWKI